MKFLGTNKNLALYKAGDKNVLVNTKTLTAALCSSENVDCKTFSPVRNQEDPSWSEIASATLKRENSPKPLHYSQSLNRSYTVPKKVSETSRSAVNLSGKTTNVTERVRNLLSSGEQLSCEDVLWVSRFFGTHEEETTNRATWLSWGGNEGKRWSEGLATRLDYDSVVADAGSYETPGVQVFVDGDENSRRFWAELDEPLGQYAASLYLQTPQNTWQAWGNGDWFDCEQPTPSDRFIELDDDCALYLAGALFDAPDSLVDLRAPNPEAWDLAVEAFDEIDWTIIDRAMVSAVEDDGFTPQDRSDNAAEQIRDANGRFAEIGAKGAIKSTGVGGTIQGADPSSGMITVSGDDGRTYEILASEFEVGVTPNPKPDPEEAEKGDLDLEGILAPKKEAPKAKAALQETPGDRLGPVEVKNAISSYEEEVNAERQERSKKFKELLEKENSIVSAAEDSDTISSPDDSDVTPIYFAIVARDDPRAVMELIAMVPASATKSEAKTFRRSGGSWIEDHSVLEDLRSATPPPVIQLNSEQLEDVLAQVDTETGDVDDDEGIPAEEQTLTAAGGADRNRGNAERLRRYWTVGPGGLKIRWNTGGDWTRCVRLLSKHLGPRAKGYCSLRHKEMTGMWPGDRRNRQSSGFALIAGGGLSYTDQEIESLPRIVRASAGLASEAVSAMESIYGEDYEATPASSSSVKSGREFVIPIAALEGLPSGDGRIFGKGSLGIRNLPVPLLWQIKTADGHDGSVIVGRIDSVERTEDGLGNARGVFDTGPYGREAQRLVEARMLNWVSVDLDKFEMDEARSDEKLGKKFISKGRLMAVTLLAKPAFQECTIELVPNEEKVMAEPSAISASASIAGSIPVEPPKSWFDDPHLNGPSPIQVSDDGRLFGHIATWDRDHIGMAGSTRAPRSSSNYAYFHTGVVRTLEGMDVKVGQLTLAGGHAPIHLDAASAVRHYDDTASAIADVHAGEDAHGIWVSGALRPGTTPEQIRSLRASAPSGDWRSINHRLELVAVCQVNVPGFPVPRALAASGASPTALVAAGTEELLRIRSEEFQDNNEAIAAAAKEKLLRVMGIDVDKYISEFSDFSPERREKLAEEGLALPDGSYPIVSVTDLRNAVQAYGRAPESKRAKVRRHIAKRARALNRPDLIPENWKEASMSDEAIASRERYAALVASAQQRRVENLRIKVNGPNILKDLKARIEKND